MRRDLAEKKTEAAQTAKRDKVKIWTGGSTDEAGNQKQIILHLPYLAFVYLFGKVGQAFRLAQGADLSAKLLHIGQGFSAAFASAAPSFHPTDLLIGLAAAVIIRLVVYSKQKNAKKYRKGMEYGTARWSA